MANHLPATTDAHASTEDHGGGYAQPTAWGFAADGWVALAMLAVFALMIWKKVPSAIGKALDKKIGTIRQQLDEATQLRKEAEALRAEYEAKSAQASAEAAMMVERARTEAAGIVAQAETDAAALIERRTRMAEDKIAAAERAAVDEVRARAARAAAVAAESLIRDKLDAKGDKAMVDATIAGLGRR
ncbi:F0F1 ATP synthase subunit B [Sphingosinicella sp. LHD-64]|uniref:F0F1 ATP synthase subunit B family protein n=1 Tax=Sphingosinicella sp. LHD-64 TaxID=3072139 RepID=UPI0028109579|nr:F0F1 ATP synthase subunit B [Sphingosinicella sp. LHD-64]MDQ8756405.1 F0F1 ATP synthase subunit B [Sphingosinicella sp. LHD-64]